MATFNSNISSVPFSGRVRAALDGFFAGLGQGFNAHLTARSRVHRIEALNARSDAELAKLGLTRDEIPRYVFRDLLGF